MKRIRQKLLRGNSIALVLLFFTVSLLHAQGGNFQVKGTVKDSKGESLIGVSVQLKGTSIGTTTDVNGAYTITLPGSSGTLVFTYVGFQSKEMPVNNNRTIDVQLETDSKSLAEVVIMGYGTQQKATVTGAVSAVKSEDLVRTPATTTSSALVGKVQGITSRSTDSRPGNGSNIQIRNLGAPLYVIDGVPFGGNSGTTAFGFSDGSGGRDAFNNLGLEDIESITILKDASASIYGLRAANGVVLVTTKKGTKSEKPSIDVSSYYGFQDFTRYFQPANAGQYVRAQLEAAQNGGASVAAITNLYSPDQLAKWEAGTEKGYKSYDYLKEITGKNVPQYYLSASARGGSQRSNYYLSASQIHQDALIKDFSYDRTNLQANFEASLATGLKVGTNISGRLEKRHNVGVPGLDDYFNPFLSVLSMWPTESPYANDNPAYINQTHNVNVNPATYTDEITGYVDELNREVNVKLNAQYDFKFGLTAKAQYSYEYANEDFSGFEYTWNAYRYNAATDTYDTQPGFGNQNPWRERHKRNITNRFGSFQLNYTKQLGNHSISGLAAVEQSDYENTYFVVHTVPPNNYIPLQALANQDFLDDQWSTEARQGYIGRINYNYKQKYILEFLGRYDGSYLYAADKRWGFFPGVTAGWRISEEPFFKNKLGFFNEFKIRGSYGEAGLETGISAFGYLGGYNFNQGSAVLDNKYVIGLRPRGLPVTQLSWATSRTTDVGIDFAVLNNKLTGSFDAFSRKRTGMPAGRYDVTVPNETGTTLANENLESDANLGMEGILNYRSKIGNVNYSVGVNATLSRLKILDRYKPRYGNSWEEYRNRTANRWANINFGYEVIGRFESQADVDNYPINNDGQGNRTQLPGDFKFRDTNGDGIISSLDQRPIGYAEGANPYASMGFTGGANWKGFSINFDFSGASMQSFQRNVELKIPFQNNGNSPEYMFADRWHRVDPYNPNSEWVPGTYPAVRNQPSHINYQLKSNFWVTNVRYFRLRNLELGYSIPQRYIKRLGLSRLRVYANGTNLFSIDNVKDFQIDPEISSSGGLVYPQQKLYNFGFNLSL